MPKYPVKKESGRKMTVIKERVFIDSFCIELRDRGLVM
jgi:hypothetical protein